MDSRKHETSSASSSEEEAIHIGRSSNSIGCSIDKTSEKECDDDFDVLDVVRKRAAEARRQCYPQQQQKQGNDNDDDLRRKQEALLAGGGTNPTTNHDTTNGGEGGLGTAPVTTTTTTTTSARNSSLPSSSDGVLPMPPPPPTTRLARNQRIEAPTPRPGAYLGSPGHDLERCDTLRYSLVGASSSSSGDDDDDGGGGTTTEDEDDEEDEETGQRTTSASTANGNSAGQPNPSSSALTSDNEEETGAEDNTTTNGPKLVEARPIDREKSVLDVDLQMIDTEAIQRKQQRQKRIFILAIILLACVIIAVCGEVFGLYEQQQQQHHHDHHHSSDEGREDSAEGEEEAAESTTIAATTITTTIPGPLEDLRAQLPQSTLRRIEEDPTSVQSKAMEWLEKHHDNLFKLKTWRKVQIYALATMYVAWDGPTWTTTTSTSTSTTTSGGRPYYYNILDWELDWINNDNANTTECQWYNHDHHNLSVLRPGGGQGATTVNACNEDGEFQILYLPKAFDLSSSSASSVQEQPPDQKFPPEIALLTNLIEIDLTDTGLGPISLSEHIWPVLSKLPSLQVLRLNSNHLTGTIPQSMIVGNGLDNNSNNNDDDNDSSSSSDKNMTTNLMVLELANNNLSGPIDDLLWAAAAAAAAPSPTTLTHLDISANPLLTGRIPDELCPYGGDAPAAAVPTEKVNWSCTDALCGCGDSYCSCDNNNHNNDDDDDDDNNNKNRTLL